MLYNALSITYIKALKQLSPICL